MATTRIGLKKQVEKSATVGSILATDTNNEATYVAPLTQNHLWGYEHGTTATLPIIIGTNLSYDAGTNTLSATAGAGGYSEVQEEGSAVGAGNTKINFIGSGLTAADAGSGVTSVSVATFLNTLATQGNVNVASQVTGTLPVANGGTGATTLTGILQGNGTSAVTAITNSSTVGQVLRVTGASTYAWGALDLADAAAVTGDLPLSNLAQGSALSVLGVAGNAIADNASIASSADHQVLRRSGTALAFGAVNLASTNAVTGILDETNGGTGQSTIATGDILYGSASNTLSKLSIGAASTYLKGGTTPSWATLNVAALSDAANVVQTSGTFTLGGTYTFSNNVVLNGTPTLDTHAVSKGYVDGLINGLSWKDSVDVATTANITLSGEQTIDGVTTSSSRILVKNQSTLSQNGIFITGAGAWTRATDMDAWSEVPAAAVFVEGGTTQADTAWVCTSNDGGTLGTTDITFVKFSSAAGVIDGSGTANRLTWWSDPDTVAAASNSYTDGSVFALGTTSVAASTILTTRGTGASNATYGVLHQDNSGSQVFRVADDGTTVIGGATPITIDTSSISRGGALTMSSTGILTLSTSSTSNRTIALNSGSSQFAHTFITGSKSQGINLQVGNTASMSVTSGNYLNTELVNIYTTTSGSSTYTDLKISTSITQTLGGTGITRGIHIIPSLTNPADYRGLEITTNASHYSLYSTAGKIRWDLGSDATGDIYYRGAGGELVRLAAGTSGHVLTANGAGVAPSYQAPAGGTVTIAYVTGSTSNTIDLDANVGTVKDRNGSNVAFTIPTDTNKFFVYLNGQLLSEGGTGNDRDYAVNTTTHVITFQFNLVSSDEVKFVKIV
jgi:hypothetical protein